MGTHMISTLRSILTGEFIRFALSGGTGFVVTFILTFLLTEYGKWWYGASYVLATFIGWVCIFVLNTWITFREASRGNTLSRFFAFLLTYTGSFALNASIVIILTEAVGVHYLLSIIAGTTVVIFINYLVSKHVLFMQGGMHPTLMKALVLVRTHIVALALALAASLIVLAPNAMLWADPEFEGIEMMMLDAENHYIARIAEVSEGHLTASNTFLPEKDLPYATPALGEMSIALFGKVFAMEPARGAVVSKSISVFLIAILVYAFAFVLSRSRIASLLSVGFVMFGYNLIGLSFKPFLDLVSGSPSGGPFILFSRLVNPSISGIFLFGGLFLMYREFFARERTTWWRAIFVGALVGLSLYITPFIYSFLGLVILITFIWFLIHREYSRSVNVFLSGAVGLLFSIPFFINYIALTKLAGYENLTRFLGLIERREFVLGALLPLMAAVVVFLWPKVFPKPGRTFFLIVCTSLFLSLNQQLVTGTYLQPGHYHWYITKPLAGIIAGLFVGYVLERFLALRLRISAVALILGVVIYNSMGFLSPWYESTKVVAHMAQSYGPLVRHLDTVASPQVIWADGDTSDYIPIYTAHDAPNSVNLGSYPISAVFFENRLFLEYRLRGVSPEAFENVIRSESHYVGDRLWGLWLREQFGDSSAVPEEEFARLALGYKAFSALSWNEAFDTLGITRIVVRVGEDGVYAKLPSLRESARVGDFVVYERN